MRLGWQIAGVGLAGLFATALFLSFGYALFDALGPGAGFFPFWLSAIGLGLSVLIVLEASRFGADRTPESVPEPAGFRRAGFVLVALVAAAALLETLGFRLTMFLFVAGLLPALGARSPAAIGAFASSGSFGVFEVFVSQLKVPLPVGVFGL